jgi:calcium-dependent protein kinase
MDGMMELILDGTVRYDSPIWETIDETAKDFVQGLLIVNPDDRMTAEEASMHRWIKEREEQPEEKPTDDVLADVDHCLLQYKNNSLLKKIALNVIAHQSTSADTQHLRKVFRQLDKSRDGVLSYDEFKTGLVKVLKYSDEDIDKLFSSIVSTV